MVPAIGVVLVGLVAAPVGRADTTCGPGAYSVPSELPYGIYIAHNQPRVYPGCMFTTKTSDGTIIDLYNGTLQDSLTAEIISPAIARFETSGCTPCVGKDSVISPVHYFANRGRD